VPWLEKGLILAEAEGDGLRVAATRFNLAVAYLELGHGNKAKELLAAVLAWKRGGEAGERLRKMAVRILKG